MFYMHQWSSMKQGLSFIIYRNWRSTRGERELLPPTELDWTGLHWTSLHFTALYCDCSLFSSGQNRSHSLSVF